jgi:hypothetical protein
VLSTIVDNVPHVVLSYAAVAYLLQCKTPCRSSLGGQVTCLPCTLTENAVLSVQREEVK